MRARELEVAMTVQNLVEEAKKLSHEEQAELLDELIRLVGPEEEDVALTPAQAEDLDRRIAEVESGTAKIIPGEVAFEQLRRRE
jgi:putative addiction module component (TIGR02574 family)